MVTRRNMIKGASLTAALAATPAARAALMAKPVLVLYDSRLPESAQFAAQHSSPLRMDIVQGHATGWAALRGQIPAGATVEGLTRHSDYTALRLALRGAGLRPATQSPVSAPLSGHDGLTRWTLKARA